MAENTRLPSASPAAGAPATETQVSQVLDAIGDAVFAVDRDERFILANRRALELWGVSAAELVGRRILEIFPGIAAGELYRATREVLETRRPAHLECASLLLDGRWFGVDIYPLPDGGAVISFRDASDRRSAEEALRASEEQLELAQHAAGIGIWDWDLATNEIRWSDEQFDLIGLDRNRDAADLMAAWLRVLHPDDRAAAEAMAHRHRESTAPFTSEFRIRRGDGTRWILAKGRTLRDAAGKPVRMLGINIDVTELKRLEQDLADSDKRYRLFAEAAVEGVVVHDFARILDVSRRFAEIFGFAPEELTGKPVAVLADLIAPEDLARTSEAAANSEERGEITGIRRDGSRFPAEFVIKEMAGHRRRVQIGILRDLSERKRSEAAQAEREERLRLAIEAGSMVAWERIPGKETVTLHASNRDLVPPSQSVEELRALIHPDDRERVAAAYQQALTGNGQYRAEYRVRGADGSLHWVSDHGHVYRDPQGRPVRVVGIAQDITERRRAAGREQFLSQLNDGLRMIRDADEAIGFALDLLGPFLEASRVGFLEIEGTGRGVVSRDWCAPGVASITGELLLAHYGAHIMARLRQARPLVVTDVRRAHRLAAVAQAHLAIGAVASVTLPVVRDRRWVAVLFLHQGEPRLWKAEEVAFAEQVTERVWTAVERARAEAALRSLTDTLEARVAERTAALETANRQLAAQIAEREGAEARLRRLQRIEAVGQLTSGVAHDFNNLLTAIIGNLEMLEMRHENDPRSAKLIAAVQQAAERGARLTAQLLAFSRQQRLVPTPVDLNRTIDGMSGLFQTTLGALRLVMELDDGLWAAYADPTQIELVILNLVINARDALAGSAGGVTITTANITLSWPERPEEPAPGDYVMVAVADTGTGIPPEILDKVFEPFFTTKEVGKGSGLGLSQVLGVAQQLDGGVRVETRAGAGTCIKVYLPRARSEAPSDAPGRGAEARRSTGNDRTAVILLVDDDSEVRTVGAAMLRRAGHEVLEAANGAAALEILMQEAARIELLIVDFAMPGMNGIELARMARSRLPALPILFITGFADTAALAADATAQEILQKPFHAAELTARAARLLNRAALRQTR